MITLKYAGISQSPYANLCWAAVTAGVLNYYARPRRLAQLCEIASAVRGEQCCNSHPSSCDKRADLARALREFDLLSDEPQRGSIAFRAAGAPSVEGEINRGRPIGVGIDFGLAAHFCIIFGFDQQAGTVAVSDPFFDDAYSISYTQLRNSYRDSGTWARTYFTKPPKNF